MRCNHYINTVFSPVYPCMGPPSHQSPPPMWTWKLCTGPRAGTILMVPTVLIHCPGDAHRAVKWLVSIFHLFKSSLCASSSLTPNGRVLPPLVRVYQNNMLIHITGQLRLHDRLHPPQPNPGATPPQSSKPPSARLPPPPPPKQHTSCTAEIVALCVEIEALWRKMAELLEHQPPHHYTPSLQWCLPPLNPHHPPPQLCC